MFVALHAALQRCTSFFYKPRVQETEQQYPCFEGVSAVLFIHLGGRSNNTCALGAELV